MNGSRYRRTQAAFTVFSAAVFLVTVILTIGMTYYLSEYYLQGDISSDLVYANHLYQTGRLVSDEWYGSTELRILRAEWIFAPLFALFQDWHMVRFVGTLIMQGLIVSAFGYLLLQVNASWSSFFLGASVLLVPYCFSYGVNVLYGCFYATFASVGFFSVALFVSLIREKCVFRTGRSILLCLLGFVASLGGPRVLLNVAAPVFLLILYMNVFEKGILADNAQRIMHQTFWIGMIYVLCALAGYVVNSKYLAEIYTFSNTSINLEFGLFGQLDEILTHLLYSFGFLNRLPLTSVRGMVALACAGVCSVYLGWGVRNCLRWQCEDNTLEQVRKAYISLFGFFALLVMIAFKALTTDGHANDTYYLLISIWVVPWAALLFVRTEGRYIKAVAASVLLILYVSGLVNMMSFVFPERYKQYGNVTFHHMELPRKMKASCEFLEEEGLAYGYATFWYANVVTEMTDGRIDVAGTVLLPGRDALLDRSYWLTREDVIKRESSRAFILLSLEEENEISQNEDMDAVRRIYGDEYFAIYEILDPENVYNGVIR